MTEQEIKDEREQAVKRGGEIYADHYMEGLLDGRNLALRQFGVMPSLPDGLDDDSNCDHNFKLGWIACWEALTGNEA